MSYLEPARDSKYNENRKYECRMDRDSKYTYKENIRIKLIES